MPPYTLAKLEQLESQKKRRQTDVAKQVTEDSTIVQLSDSSPVQDNTYGDDDDDDDDTDIDDTSDDSDGCSEDSDHDSGGIVNISFDFMSPKDQDYHSIRNLLSQLYSVDAELINIDALADYIIEVAKGGIGSVVQNLEDDVDPDAAVDEADENQATAVNGQQDANGVAEPSSDYQDVDDLLVVNIFR